MIDTDGIAHFAVRFGVKPESAHVLPALFQVTADKLSMDVDHLIFEAAYSNVELGEYMADIARDVADDVPR